MIKREEIRPGVFLTEIEGHYKKSRLAIYVASPLERETLTHTAMLPFVLERGTAKLPDLTALKRKLNALYGASLFADYSCAQYRRVLEGYVDGVDGALVRDGSDISAQRTGLLLDVLFHPHVENGRFSDEWVDIEREKLRETIRSIINDKRDYCIKLLTEAFFAADERSLPVDGYEEDLDGIDGQRLYDAYKGFVKNAGIEIVYVGSRYDGLKETVLTKLSRLDIVPARHKPLEPVDKQQEQVILREMDIEQSKLALAFTPGRLLESEEWPVLRVACGILGASPMSRLFLNVREKQSLCYYASAQASYRAGGGIIVDSGIAHKDAGRAKKAMLKEIRDLAQDGPTKTEMEQIKLLYQNVLRGVTDSSAALANYCYANIIKYGRPITPQQELDQIERVTADQVRQLLGEMHLNVSCLLSGGKE